MGGGISAAIMKVVLSCPQTSAAKLETLRLQLVSNYKRWPLIGREIVHVDLEFKRTSLIGRPRMFCLPTGNDNLLWCVKKAKHEVIIADFSF